MYLRPMLASDLPTILTWRNHPDVRRNMYTHHEITEVEHQNWWNRYSKLEPHVAQYFIAVNDDLQPVGFISFTNHVRGNADWAFFKDPFAPKGTGKLMEQAALVHAFKTLAIRKLSCEVLAYNKPVYYLHRKFGFRLEGVLRKAHAYEGRFHDIYRLALSADEFDESSIDWKPKTSEEQFVITEQHIDAFADLSGDRNTVHFGPKRIAQGILTASFISSALAKTYPGGIYLKQNLEFRKTVKPGDQLKVVMKEITRDHHRIWIETTVTRNNDCVLSGEAVLLL